MRPLHTMFVAEQEVPFCVRKQQMIRMRVRGESPSQRREKVEERNPLGKLRFDSIGFSIQQPRYNTVTSTVHSIGY